VNVTFTANAWVQYTAWLDTDPKVLARINALIKDALRDPFRGIGKPEPLRRNLHGYWSRRITQEHRLVYRATSNELQIAQVGEHY